MRWRVGQAVQVRRDPFARAELMRAAVTKTECGGETCHWCGGTRAHGGLFAYWWESDSVRYVNEGPNVRHLFCCIGCFEAYSQ